MSIETAVECIGVAIVAVVAFGVLMEPGMILGWWYQWLERVNARAPWIAKPLGYCGVCFSGQLGFWWYLVEYRGEWRLTDHIMFVSLVIFFFINVKAWMNKKELL